MNKILILGGIFLHKKLVEAAHEQGYKTIVIDNVPNSPAKLISDQSFDINVTEVDRIVELCKKEGVTGVITGYIDFCQRYYQQICERLGVPCYGNYEQFQILTNKEQFKRFCIENNVDTIPFYSENDIISKSSKVEFPVYVKPSYSRGSRGQFVCNDFIEALNAIKEASKISNDGKSIIEKYLGNNDNFQVTYFVVNGTPFLLRTVDQYQGNKELGLEKLCLAAVSPSRYTEMYISNVHPKVVNMIKNLGIKNGPVFFQGFIDKDTVRFYDPGLRFPGTDYSVVLKLLMGIDTARALVEFAMTGKCESILEHLDENSVFLKGKYIINLFPTLNAGCIKTITDDKEIMKIPGIKNISFRHGIGDVIRNSGDVTQRIAEVNMLCNDKTDIINTITLFYKEFEVFDTNNENLINNIFDPKTIEVS